MTDKLKFTVSYSKTLNIGNFESEKYTLSEEYYKGKDEISIEQAFVEVKSSVEKMMYGVTE